MIMNKTMTGKERVISALTFNEFDRVPIEAFDCVVAPADYPGWFSGGRPGEGVSYFDGWGCRWDTAEKGVCGEVKYHPLADDWKGFEKFKPPYDALENIDFGAVERFCAGHQDQFITVQWEPAMPNIFERMQHLRGTENLFMDLAYGDGRVLKLRDMLRDYYLLQMEKWCDTPVDCMQIHDDWGSQISLLISPETWRGYFRPVYRDLCDMAKRRGKYLLFHSDGFITSIIPDMIEIGVNALNSQLFCMPIEELAEKYHHKICFWGEIDRQHIQVFGTPQDMRAAVHRIAGAFFRYGRTGFVAQCTYTMNVPQENKDAEHNEWNRISDSF
jgi:hypothetical protein